MLRKVVDGRSITKELSITKVDARFSQLPTIQNENEELFALAMVKTIYETFEYFNTQANDSITRLIIDDVHAVYGKYSALEIIKAIVEGRRKTKELYGKLSAKHFMDWIHEYEIAMQQELAKHHQNKKHDDLMTADEVRAAYKKFNPKKEERHSSKEKADAYSTELRVSEKESKRREYSRAWNLAEHGDYKAYMDKFK